MARQGEYTRPDGRTQASTPVAPSIEETTGPPVDAAVPEEADDVASRIAQLGAELQALATDRAKRTAKLREVEAYLGKLRIEDFPELAESPVIQSFVKLLADPAKLRPGETRNPGSLAEVSRHWTWEDLRRFPTKTFTPNESLPLTWNGLTIYVQQEVEATVPEPFYDLYRDHRRALAQREKHENYMLGYSDEPPDPNYLTSQSALVRAYSLSGPHPDPRRRGVGRITLEEPTQVSTPVAGGQNA